MTNMIERVARAIAEAEGAPVDASVEDATPMAIAAIKAMRETTDEMIESANNVELAPWSSGWQAMIDAALTPKIEE